jgi:hypothetical protein
MPYTASPISPPLLRALLLLIALAWLALASGCAVLDAAGIGGEPLLQCQRRTGKAFIDDTLLGGTQAHFSVVRRMRDADALCETAASGSKP